MSGACVCHVAGLGRAAVLSCRDRAGLNPPGAAEDRRATQAWGGALALGAEAGTAARRCRRGRVG